MYLDALTERVPWFVALDHTNYVRYIPVHKAHEQNNACSKRDGGAVGLIDNPSALQRWLVAGPEVTALIKDFEDAHQLMERRHEVIHHDQTANVQNAFRKDVCSLSNVMEVLGNPFEEESEDLLVLDSKEIAHPSAVEAVKKAQRIGQQQFQTFTKECLVERTKPTDDTIHRNRLKLFVGSRTKSASKKKQQLILMKNDVELFSRLYITCQTRDGNLEDFFQQENQAWPPALSDGGRLRLGTKSDILTCLDDLSPSQTKTHDATCIVLDGAAIKQMMKPAAAKTFDEYSQQVFIPYILSQLRSVSRVDLVWDTYKDDSLKGTARAMRGKGVRCGWEGCPTRKLAELSTD